VDVLFVDLPFNTYELGRRFQAAWSHKETLSPHELHLGFRYMVSSLRAAGHSADIVFPALENGLTTRHKLAAAIREIDPRVLGFTSYEGSLGEAMRFIRRLRSGGVTSLVCLGGHLATFSYSEILRDFHDLVDMIVLGEGEQAIIEIAAAVKEGRGFQHIAGLAWFDARQGRVVTTARRPIERNIDRLPFPMLPQAAVDPDVPLFLTTSRGCYGNCSFCRSTHFGERWRARDPRNVVNEIEQACAAGVTTFEMVDDNFLGPGPAGKRRAAAVAAEIVRRGLSIGYHISCRVNDADEPTLRALKESGLISVSLGVESGVQRMLDTFHKNTTVDQNVTALRLLAGLGIPTLVYIIFFDPYTTLAEAKENLTFLRELRRIETVRFELILFRKLIPVSGTELFAKLRDDGLLRGDYLRGHRFAFRDSRVGLLSDFLECIDLRFERVRQMDAFRDVRGIYALKERLQFALADQAIDLLASTHLHKSAALERLDALLHAELVRTCGFNPAEPPVAPSIAGRGDIHHVQTETGVR
jgi:radical SAM superfamily enzyme YgiQ (UPF0313 family)